jgi:hypothetical protein
MCDYSFFHSSFWAKALIEAYRYAPFYFLLKNGKNPIAALACMEVNSVLTGKRGVCLPFSDYCPPLSTDLEHQRFLLSEVFRWGKDRGWSYIEWRAGDSVLEGQFPYLTYLGHRVPLHKSEDVLLGLFRNSTKRNIEKAVRLGVQSRILRNEEAIQAFYNLNCITRRNHGLPPQPMSFFKKFYKHIISQKNGCVILACHNDKPIAASIYVHFGNKAVFKYGASDRRFHYLRPNNLIMYEAIKLYSSLGCQTLELGRTDIDSNGLLQFKRGWGSVEYPIHYYRYNLKQNRFENSGNHSSKYKPLVRRLPIPLLRVAGKLLYRHIG